MPPLQAMKVGESLKDSPEFYRVMKASDGSIVSLAMFVNEKKQPLVLFFYPKAGTPGCTKEVRLGLHNKQPAGHLDPTHACETRGAWAWPTGLVQQAPLSQTSNKFLTRRERNPEAPS